MNATGCFEPDKYWSACQAALIMTVSFLPLALTFSFDRTIMASPVPLEVAIVAQPVAPVADPEEAKQAEKELAQEAKQQQELQEAAEQVRQAELARRREKELEQQRIEDERRREKEAELRRIKQEEQEERERQERLKEERLREEKQEQQRLEKKKQEERERQERLEQERQAAEEARQAKIKEGVNARIIDRYVNGIHDQVQRYLSNPEGVQQDIEVEFRLRLGPDGHLIAQPEILEKSGNKTFDDQALRAVLRSAQDGFKLPDDPELRARFGELILRIKPKT